MSTEKISNALFLEVKQKLDYHRFPTIFPIEAAPLLLQVLRKIDEISNLQSSQK
jgi:hypothetical protein